MGQLSRSDLGNPKHAAMLGHICSYETGCIWQREKEKQCKHMSISSLALYHKCSISGHIQEATNISRIGYLTIYQKVQVTGLIASPCTPT